MQVIVHSGAGFRWRQPEPVLTPDRFRDDKKGGLFSRKGPYLYGKIVPMGAPLYREDGACHKILGPREDGPGGALSYQYFGSQLVKMGPPR